MRQEGVHNMETITHTPSGAAFDFLRRNDREPKPRTHGITEIRGPYYTPFGKRALQDILETMGPWVDTLKFAGGSFTLMPDRSLEELIALSHEHGVLVSTGGFIERVLTQGGEAVTQYIDTCRAVGFDIIELSSGFITIPADDWLRLMERVQRAGLKAKPEVGIQFGAGGATTPDELAAEGTHDVAWAIKLARRFLDAGAYQIMNESEGITENVRTWRTDPGPREPPSRPRRRRPSSPPGERPVQRRRHHLALDCVRPGRDPDDDPEAPGVRAGPHQADLVQ